MSMNIHQLLPADKSHKKSKRLGRGIGSGLGKTSGKGHKGQWARSGGGVRIGFEGGQKSLLRRLPKRGFDNAWKKKYTILNLRDLEIFDDETYIDIDVLFNSHVIAKKEQYGLKILGNGNLTKKLNIIAAKFSKKAKLAIDKAGGTATEIIIKIIDNSAVARKKARRAAKAIK